MPGCFIKCSTDETRKPGSGLIAIQQHIGRLQATHMQHVMAYGKGSLQRVLSQSPHASGELSQCSSGAFSCSVGRNPQSLLVVPTTTMLQQCGYYVDRRPAANVNPYTVVMLLLSTTLGVPLPCSICPSSASPQATLVAAAAQQQQVMLQAAAAQQQLQYNNVMAQAHHSSGRSTLSHGSVCAPSTLSWGCDSRATSLNTEDVLIDELERIDGGERGTGLGHGLG